MRELELRLVTAQGEVILDLAIDDPEAWRLLDDSTLAAETAEQAIADAGIDYRVVNVQGHFPASESVPHIVPVHVEPFG